MYAKCRFIIDYVCVCTCIKYSTLFAISGKENKQQENQHAHTHTHTKHLTIIHKRTQYYTNMPKYLYTAIDN